MYYTGYKGDVVQSATPPPTKNELYERSRATEAEYKAELKLRVAGIRGDISYDEALEIVNTAVRYAAQIASTDALQTQSKAA